MYSSGTGKYLKREHTKPRRFEITAGFNEIFSAIHHEIRTPLNSLEGFPHIIKKKTASDQQKGICDIIINTSRQILEITTRLTDLEHISTFEDKKTFFEESLGIEYPNLRTYTNTIKQASKHLSKNKDEIFRYQNVIDISIIRLEDTIRKITDTSMINSNAFDVKKRTLELNTLMRTSFEQFQSYNYNPQKHNINLKLPLGSEDIEIETQPYMFKRITHELLDNACKFTPYGNINFSYIPFFPNKLLVYVKDEGTGFDEKKGKDMFTEYKQLSIGPEKKYQGMGLGLYIVSSFTELMNENILAADRQDRSGAYFAFTQKTRMNRYLEAKYFNNM
ncbi:MAG: ATP-binding protein [Nanobdellota archaeon]